MQCKNIETTANETYLSVMTSAERVVALLPSATEIVAALGCASRLVGRSHECDYPSGVESLPVCTRPRVELGGSSAEIDASVRNAVKDAVAIYEVLEDQLRNLAPDVIVTQSQCEVCAVSFEEVEAAVASWSGPLYVLAPQWSSSGLMGSSFQIGMSGILPDAPKASTFMTELKDTRVQNFG